MTRHITRRTVVASGLAGAGWLGLRALATGLPASFLLRADTARGDELPTCTDPAAAQGLILSISGDGDPINANAPGTYADPEIIHPAVPSMAPAPLRLGAVDTVAATKWSTLPPWVLDRTCFFHLATMTTIHPDIPKVLQLMGATTGQEMLPSVMARHLAGCLATVQTAPASLIGSTRPEYVTYGGNVLPNLNPIALRDMLVRPGGPLTQLTQLRDKSMDKLHARLKAAGAASAAQRAFVDSLAKSRGEARSISDALVNNLNAIKGNDTTGEIIGAVALIAMNVTPVVVIRIPFGGDNHADPNLLKEIAQTESGIDAIGTLMSKLKELALEDRVTFATLNVFGRTLKQLGTQGRNHWANHQVSLMIGKRVRAGVVGGVVPGPSQDYTALPIDSQTGLGTTGGDIPVQQTLGAFGKTLGAALGVPADVLDQNITKGVVVPAALA